METLLIAAMCFQLGDKQYHHREQATKILSAMSFQALPFLETCTDSRNPEIARRSNSIINRTEGTWLAWFRPDKTLDPCFHDSVVNNPWNFAPPIVGPVPQIPLGIFK